MKQIQKDFFECLAKIQMDTVNIMLCNKNNYKSTEEILLDITYDTIVRVMELIDGHYEKKVKYDLIDRNTLESVKSGAELHDLCADFLKCTSN